MNFHSVEIFPRDVNCRKRHHSGSALLHMRAAARRIAEVQLLQLCYTSDYRDRSMSAKWAQNENKYL